MTTSPDSFTAGSLYLAGFAQARAPHIGLIIPTGNKSGCLVHIRVDRETSPTWTYQCRTEKIEGNMFLSSLLNIHDISDGAITPDRLRAVATTVPALDNDDFGECGPWVCRVVEQLHKEGLVILTDVDGLSEEFNAFALQNQAFARRDRFPNVAISQMCS